MSLDVSKCIHCGKCTKNCTFLTKHGLDISQIDELNRLAYHCFLCGECTRVCPVGIDGRGVLLNLREKQVTAQAGHLGQKGYGMLRLEKERYLFKNYRQAKARSLLFPGCNFPSFYPATTRALLAYLNRFAPTGLAYDCCGKPIAELGLRDSAARIIRRLNEQLAQNGVEELVLVCPNCYYYLKPLVAVRVVSIYEKLAATGLQKQITAADPTLFRPCPDRLEEAWMDTLRPFLPAHFQIIEDVQCCGLGGCAAVKEPELARGFLRTLREKKLPAVYTYCGTCAGNMARAGVTNVRHLLVELLETNEEAQTGTSLLNRIKTRFV